jgi:hypothetical protein
LLLTKPFIGLYFDLCTAAIFNESIARDYPLPTL